jgi:BirA family biotin operon repressor/biotin-[acetyl-CoA-carboxylase] ligase
MTVSEPRLDASSLTAGLPASRIVGREILVFEETSSTNDLAARAGRDGAAEGIVIFAETQRAGRGRLGRVWNSPPRQSLLCSVLLRPRAPRDQWPALTFCAALAVAEAAEELTGSPAAIKWPNDVFLQGRKISGILLETHQSPAPGFVVMGIGINVLQSAADFPPGLRSPAGSLSMAATAPISREAAAICVLRRLDRHYLAWPGNAPGILAACQSRGCHEPASRS